VARRGLLVAMAGLSLGGCAGAEHAKLPSATITSSTASTGTTQPLSPTTPAPKPKAAQRRTPKQSHALRPPGSSSQASVETVTSDGSVLVLDNRDVYSTSAEASGWDGESVDVSEDESTITKADNGEQLEVTKVGDTSSAGPYPGAGADHNQDTSSPDGAIIVLEDGSVWDVADTDQATASTWTDAASIHVGEEESGGNYVLHNTDDESSVTASYVGDK
jgi:hypothetical protein